MYDVDDVLEKSGKVRMIPSRSEGWRLGDKNKSVRQAPKNGCLM